MQNRGFSMMELLVVVAVVGILSSLGLSQYSEYRTRAFDASAHSDLKNLINAEEAYYVENQSYLLDYFLLDGFYESKGVEISMGGTTADYSVEIYHPAGTNTYCYDGGGQAIRVLSDGSSC